MAESTLAIEYFHLQADVGLFLGWGRGAQFNDPAWDDRQTFEIKRCTDIGTSKFYHCGYSWSFLKPMATLTLHNGHNILPLPDDYGAKEGPLTLTLATGSNWWQMEFTSPGMVLANQAQYPTATGRPQMVCEEPIKGTGLTSGQRMQLRFWPTADQDYPITFQYYLLPDALNGGMPYLYGGAQHMPTIREACLSVAEKLLDDAASIHDVEFQRLLAVSKDLDARNKPTNLGTNRDRSDQKARLLGPYWRRSWSPISFKGVVY